MTADGDEMMGALQQRPDDADAEAEAEAELQQRQRTKSEEDVDAAYDDDDDLADSKPRKKRRVIKTSDKKYQCPHSDCGKSYSRAEHLYRHQLNRTCLRDPRVVSMQH